MWVHRDFDGLKRDDGKGLVAEPAGDFANGVGKAGVRKLSAETQRCLVG
jgi:hypothetical protein